MANAPLAGRDGDEYSADLRFGKTEIFFLRGLDRQVTDLPDRAPTALQPVTAPDTLLPRLLVDAPPPSWLLTSERGKSAGAKPDRDDAGRANCKLTKAGPT
jgi:hypothetical protein